MSERKKSGINLTSPITWVIGVVAIILIFVVISKIIKLLWWIVGAAMPILLILTFIIDRSVIVNYINRIRKLFKTNRNIGIVVSILSVLGFPFVVLFLFLQALSIRNAKKQETQAFKSSAAPKGEYIEFEELDSQKLDLNNPPKEKKYSSDEEPPTKLW